MFGLIEIPPNDDESLCILFFTKKEAVNNYIKLFQEKYQTDQTKFKIVKIMKHYVFDAGANDNDCYYKFDPKLDDHDDHDDLDETDEEKEN